MAGEWTWDFAPLMRRVYLTLPDAAQVALLMLMEEITGEDPRGLRQKAAAIDPGGHMERVPFGTNGLVVLLIHVRGKHVEILQITWTGS